LRTNKSISKYYPLIKVPFHPQEYLHFARKFLALRSLNPKVKEPGEGTSVWRSYCLLDVFWVCFFE
jgi:hypothetical protein